MTTLEFKPKFIDRYSKLTDFEEFRKICNVFLRRSIRVNTLKASVAEIKKRLEIEWRLTPVPWCKEGFWIDHRGEGEEYRRDVGNIPEHSLGYFFIQEAASMIPPIVLDPRPGEKVLDMCASPGSKSTQIAQYMKNTGVLVSNDYKYDRLKPLALNLQRMGVMNCIVNLSSGRHFKDLDFDKILVDAPCSGTGAIRKSWKTLRIWNPNMIRRLAGTQKQLIEAAYASLKPGGTLVYSTCSLEPEENEGVVSDFLSKHDDMKIVGFDLPGLKRSRPVTEYGKERYDSRVSKTLRIWPQDNDTEGFFVAKFVRE